MSESEDRRRLVPRTDRVLADDRLRAATARLGSDLVKHAVRAAQQLVRDGALEPEAVVEHALAALPQAAADVRPVLNATGVVVHTNLGRAALSSVAVEAVVRAAGATDVEFDLDTGRRAARGRGALAALAEAVPSAEAVAVVNNGAAALLLATTALAATPVTTTEVPGIGVGSPRELLISRGEMVEIGDGFRLPDLISSAGARLREVGTTNRTSLDDYAAAVGPDTAGILKIHPSNFVVQGFTSTVAVADLAALGERSGVPVVVDIGSGLLRPDPLLPDEPDADTALRDGAALVTASGDKLLGGPQAGLIMGRAELVHRLRRHPMARALRVDKLTLAALEATLRGPVTPTWTALRADPEELRRRCEAVVSALDDLAETGLSVSVVASDGAIGGGGAPGRALPGWAVALPEGFAARLRTHQPSVVGRIERSRCLLDLRTVPPESDAEVITAVRDLVSGGDH